MRNPLVDNEFLKKLHEFTEREVYAKVIVLDLNEQPIEKITGRVTQGSISVDGTSAVRRTCSLTLVAQDVDINEYYWGMNSKIQLYIGLKNFIDDSYPEIIWFKQGLYLLTTFNTSQNVNGYTISIQGKDKMCLLNGDIGGAITELSVDFAKIDVEDTDENGVGLGTFTQQDLELKDIVIEAVHKYGKEPYHNIIVNDLDDVGLELYEYRGEDPMYFVVNEDTGEVSQPIMDGSKPLSYYDENGKPITIYLNTLADEEFDSRLNVEFGDNNEDKKIVYNAQGIRFSFYRVETGQTAGYRITPLTYVGDLVGQVGNAITNAVLDPIVKQLGDFEYFYNDDGQFIFQRKRTFVNVSWNNLVKDPEGDTYAQANAFTNSYTYSFENSNLITAFNNTPGLNNVKNDFALWGVRKGISGAEIPIHMRYAIDKKPISYTTYEGETYTVLTEEEAMAPIVEEKLKEFLNIDFKKSPMPDCLDPDDWWEVHDWANYYHIITGEYPNRTMGEYITEWTQFDLNKYFPPGYTWNKECPLFLFDLNPDGTLGFAGHNPSTSYTISDDKKSVLNSRGQVVANTSFCGHEYQGYFVARDVEAYFYKPTIPGHEYTSNLEDTVREEVRKLFTLYTYECEWREVLYQMARDYLKHGHEDDFMAVIAENNGDLYPSGTTGYEQYYIDMQGFWRQLYNPYLTRIEMFEYDKVAANTAKGLFENVDASKKTILYKHIDGQYLQVKSEEIYNPRYTYFQRKSYDNAEKHLHHTYYQLVDNKYIPLDEKYVTSVIGVDLDTKYYYKDGAEYISYVNFNPNAESYYSYHMTKEPLNIDPFATYLTSANKAYPFPAYATVYDKATVFEQDRADNKEYYSYNPSTGVYTQIPDLTGFSPKNTYYIRRRYPLLQQEFAPLYINKGYQPVPSNDIKRGVEYYIKSPVEKEDGTTEYEYKKSFVLGETTAYYVSVGGQNAEVKNFAQGKTYTYTENNQSKTLTIPNVPLFYKEGLQPIKQTTCSIGKKDRAYYVDDNGKNIFLPMGYFILGKLNYYYRYENDTLKVDDDFEEGFYYTYTSSIGYERKKILKKFNRSRVYYISGDNEYIPNNKPYDEKAEYYLQVVNWDGSTVIGYAKYNEILDFSKESPLGLYIIDDGYTISGTSAYENAEVVMDRRTNQIEYHRMVGVNRTTAIYDESLLYFARAVNSGKFYRIFKTLNSDTFGQNAFSIYTKNPNMDFIQLKHMSFSGVGSKVNTKDYGEVILTGEYYETADFDPDTFWTYTLDTPEYLNFWFDFLDTDGEVSRYSNYAIGNRPKTENDNKMNAIYYRETPQVIFVDNTISEEEFTAQKEMKPGYAFIQVTDQIQRLFSLSTQGKTAQDVLNSSLYKYTYCTESVSITSLPVYHLQPNTRIFIKDIKAGINGEYIISRITIPLTYNGTMNISAVKAVERIY